jgi:hypothetical protein
VSKLRLEMTFAMRTVGLSMSLLVFSSLFVPTKYFEVKVALIAVALIGILVILIESKIVFSKQTFFACVFISSFGLANSVYGFFNSSPGALRVLTVMMVWPLLYPILSLALNQFFSYHNLVRTLLAALMAVVFYSYLLLGYKIDFIPSEWFFDLGQEHRVAFYEGKIRMHLLNHASLLFLLPFFMHYSLYQYRISRLNLLHILFLALAFVLVIASGRKALQLVVLITPISIWLFEWYINVSRAKVQSTRIKVSYHFYLLFGFSAFLGLISYLNHVFQFDLFKLYDNFIGGFNFSDDANSDALVRGEQFESLMGSWQNGSLTSILFGQGNGSHTDVLRDDEGMPWSYELTYIYLLFSNGLVGVTVYGLWFWWGILRIKRALLHCPSLACSVLPIISGTFGLAIGAASNPYFGKFDYLWIIFLPHLLAGAAKYQFNAKGESRV